MSGSAHDGAHGAVAAAGGSARRVLLLLSQLPHDPTSGAALTMLALSRLLARAGMNVRAIATSAIEGAAPLALLPLLAGRGIRAEVDRRAAVGKGRPVVRFRDEGGAHGGAGSVHCTILDVGKVALKDWEFLHGAQFNRLVMNELESFSPDVVLTFGGQPAEQSRRYMCRAAGAAVVFAVSNLSYLHPLAFEHVDAVLTPSCFMRDLYAREIGLRSTAIAPPIELSEALVEPGRHEARYCTFVNPTPPKGLFFFVTLAEVLGRTRPDIPLQVIEGRGTREHLFKAAALGGFDLSRHPNLRVVGTRARSREVYADARVMLVPSVWTEAFGRIAVEAMHNGVPAIVSGRGGLAEAVGGQARGGEVDGAESGAGEAAGGLIVPIPRGITPSTMQPVTRDAVREWVEAIVRLHDDPEHYRAVSARARAYAEAHHAPEAIERQYVEFFRAVRAGGGAPVAGAARPAGA
ncbi:MAG: glycosyltransferase [Phycisphaerales bacterium]